MAPSGTETRPLISDITSPSFRPRGGDGLPSQKNQIIAILTVLFGIPILLCAIPIALINVFIIQKYVFPPSKEETPTAPILNTFTPENPIPYEQRQYDLVVYGATGFTGSLAVDYIIKQYCKDPTSMPFRWAIGGRNRTALQKVLTNAIEQNELSSSAKAELKGKIDIIIADSGNVQELTEMVKNSRSIITTTGPFSKYGNDLVALSAAYGTHLSDITGESDWVRKMIDNYEIQAQKSGAIITSMAGHDCIPWDIACYNAAKKLDELKSGQKVTKFEVYDRVSGSISGGTLATIIHSLTGREKYKAKLGFDPLMSYFGKKSKNDLKVSNQNFLSYDTHTNSFIGPFVMAAVMGNCVKRSTAINHYSGDNKKTLYKEMMVYANWTEAIINFFGLLFLGVGLFIPGLPSLMQKVLPPGTGPTVQEQEEGYLLVQVIATGDQIDSSGKPYKTESWCYIPNDPGYYYTARMLVETGLVPILNKNQLSTLPNFDKKLGNIGGYWTPASGTGPLLQKRLEDIDIQFITRQFKQ